MGDTPFPTNPAEVARLTVFEFASDLDLNRAVSLDSVCGRFVGDTNRALVWLIRFRALTTWRARTDIADWLLSEPTHVRDACEVAATFELNDDWEFDVDSFRSAVASAVR